jgi:hypothetical protein
MKHTTRRSRRALAAALLATALPLVAVGTAQASTTSSGCTVSPLRPVFDHFNASGVKVIRYNMTVSCDAGRTIEIEQHVHEADSINADDHITTSNRSRYFATTDTVTMWLENSLPDTEIGDEEMYQRVSFRVTSNGVTSPWTAWEDSPEQQFSK